MELENLSSFANSKLLGVEKVGATLTTDNTGWARRELAGLAKAMAGVRDELVNNFAKMSDVDDRKSEVESHLARKHRNMTETNDTEIQIDICDWIRKLERDLSDIELERQARLEALSMNRAALRSQINRIRETFRRLLHEDTTLAERIRTLFREQGITIASILSGFRGSSWLEAWLLGAVATGAPDVTSWAVARGSSAASDPLWTVPAGGAIFPWNALSPLVTLIGSDSFIPGLWPIAASDAAMMTLLL